MSGNKELQAIASNAIGVYSNTRDRFSLFGALTLSITAIALYSLEKYSLLKDGAFYATILTALSLVAVVVVGFLSNRNTTQSNSTVETSNKVTHFVELPVSENQNYDILSSLTVYRYEKGNEEDSFDMSILTIKTLRSLVDGDFSFLTTHSTSNVINNIGPISDPVSMEVTGEGKSAGSTKLDIVGAKRGDLRIVAFEHDRTVNIGTGTKAKTNSELHKTINSYLKTDRHDFAGSSIVAPTGTVRFLLHFPEGCLPGDFVGIQIDNAGNKKDPKFNIKTCADKNLVIAECVHPDVSTTLLLFWVWP